ncbi:MAG: GTPase Era [Desulfosarcina sp.]|nr:GTPase Era [Desulfobacterales bacterium]
MTVRPDPDFKGFHSGFVAILGAPNAGKSTLLNRMLGQKIAITSKKPQTTRNRILGVVHREKAQLVFIDTPGIHKARSPLNARIVDTALSVLADVDLVLILVDAARPEPSSETYLLRRLETVDKPVVLALNKIDLVPHDVLLARMAAWSERRDFKAILAISALRGLEIDTLLAAMQERLPEGPPFFPEDTLTDAPERFIVAELIREKVFRLTGEEIPYASAVTVESFKENPRGGMIRIHASIHLERHSQKGIVIGKGGLKLKEIGRAARTDIERLLATRVYLELFVRVQKNWRRDTRALRKFGY